MISCETLVRYLAPVPFPASKEELVTFLQEQAAPAEAVWLVERMPGRDFRFLTDVENTARLAHELHLDKPLEREEESNASEQKGSTLGEQKSKFLPGPAPFPGEAWRGMNGYPSDEYLARMVRERLHRCRGINPWLIRVQMEGKVVTLDGRVTDVPQGILAARIAQGVPGVQWVINNLDVTT